MRGAEHIVLICQLLELCAQRSTLDGSTPQGSRKWIGTTECAALLRFFGVRAHVVDFHGGKGLPRSGSATAAAASGSGASVHAGVRCDLCGMVPIVGTRHRSLSVPDFDVCDACITTPAALAAVPFESSGGSGSGAAGGPVTSRTDGVDPIASGTDGGALPAPAGSGADAAAAAESSNGAAAAPDAAPSPAMAAAAAHIHAPLIRWVWRYFSGDDHPSDPALAAPSLPSASSAAAGVAPLRDAGGAPSTSAVAGAGPSAAAGASSFVATAAGTSLFVATAAGAGQGPLCLSLSSRGCCAATATNRPPLYFQHEGHSRTIIGIERRPRAMPPSGGASGGASSTAGAGHSAAPSAGAAGSLAGNAGGAGGGAGRGCRGGSSAGGRGGGRHAGGSGRGYRQASAARSSRLPLLECIERSECIEMTAQSFRSPVMHPCRWSD